MSDTKDQVLAALRTAPLFAGAISVDRVTRLGGLTNIVNRVDMGANSVIVRIAGAGTEAYIDREVEAHNARAAARAGVSAEVLHTEPATGLMIATAIPDVETMTPALFKSRKGAPSRAGAALAKLHGSGETFQFHFDPFAMIDDYLTILATKDVNLPEGYDLVVQAAAPIKDVLAKAAIPLAPCHCDPLCENFLDDGKLMWIVDWEYSGMCDPLWDLADLSVEAGMDGAQEAELLMAYFVRAPTAAEIGRVVIHKAMCDLLWTLWGLIQHADNNPAEDFWAYATGRFERCKALMQDDAFQSHVDAVRAA